MKENIIAFNISNEIIKNIDKDKYNIFQYNTIKDIDIKNKKILLLDLDQKNNYKDILTKFKNLKIIIIGLISPTRIRIATKLLKDGLNDYLIKTSIDNINNRLSQIIAAEINKVKKDKELSFLDILNSNTKIKKTFNNLVTLSNANIPILIQGEQGCEQLSYAKSIHNLSNRKNNEFLEIFCPTLTIDNINEVLFNKFDKISGGTIFFEDIELLEEKVQNFLFKILENKATNYDIRIISSTTKELEEEIKEGKFREDLYFLFNGSCLKIPSLREVRNIIPILVKNLYKYYSIEQNKEIKGITNKALKILESYDWPGNIKEIKTVINKAVILTNKNILDEKDFSYLKSSVKENLFNDYYNISLKDSLGNFKTMEVLEKEIIEKYLKINNGNITEVAKLLNLGRTTLYRKIEND